MRGFSLIELIVVLALLGVTAAAVAPAMLRATTASPLDQAAASIADTLRDVRRRALQDARAASLIADINSDRFWVMRTTSSSRDSVHEGRWSLPAGVTLAHVADRVEWRFGPSGPLRPDSLVIRNSGGVRIVVVDPWTGAVMVR